MWFIESQNPVKELLWVHKSYCGCVMGGGELRAVVLRVEQVAFHPVAKAASQGQEENRLLLRTCCLDPFPHMYFFFLWLKFRATIPVHSSQKVGRPINDFLCLDDKWFSSLRDKFVFWRSQCTLISL